MLKRKNTNLQRKKKSRRDTLAEDAKSAVKIPNSDRTMFKERDNNDLLPETIPNLRTHLSEDDDDLWGTDDEFQTNQQTETSSLKKKGSFKFANMKTIFDLDDFALLYKAGPKQVSTKKCIIMSSNPCKIAWDLFILSLLLLVCIVVPYRLAFYPESDTFWNVTYISMDFMFLIDIIVTFFTSVSDDITCTEIVDRKIIASLYLKGWFAIDAISIFPFDLLATASQGGEVSSLVRFSKIGKLYKLIRMTRLVKVAKVLKSRNSIMSQFTGTLKISSGVERMMFFGVVLIFFFHISACMFIVVGQFDSDRNSWLNTEYGQMSEGDLYVFASYFVVTTISTVGYGDMSASTPLERFYCVVLMLTGVSIFTFISGALSSILSNYDNSQAALQERLLYLTRLRSQYGISDELYFEIKKALTYDHQTNFTGLDAFIGMLPVHLKLEVSEEIHRKNFQKFTLFSKLGNKHFIAWIGARLKP